MYSHLLNVGPPSLTPYPSQSLTPYNIRTVPAVHEAATIAAVVAMRAAGAIAVVVAGRIGAVPVCSFPSIAWVFRICHPLREWKLKTVNSVVVIENRITSFARGGPRKGCSLKGSVCSSRMGGGSVVVLDMDWDVLTQVLGDKGARSDHWSMCGLPIFEVRE